jgi:hypothetical protein
MLVIILLIANHPEFGSAVFGATFGCVVGFDWKAVAKTFVGESVGSYSL